MLPRLKTALYFPTTILLVDDDKNFTNSLRLNLKDMFLVRASSDIREALSALEKSGKFFQEFFGVGKDPAKNIKKLLSSPSRTDFITTVIVDYDMPEMNGIEFCKKISHAENKQLKKYMLTGEADSDTAVHAFNEKYIDKFFKKGRADVFDALDAAICWAQREFFESIFLQRIVLAGQDKFWEFFYRYCDQHDIVEYGMIDKNGSAIMADENNKFYFLIVKSAAEFQALADVASGNNADPEMTDAIRQCKKAPVFYDEAQRKLPVSAWKDIAADFREFPGISGYFYAFGSLQHDG